MATQTAPQEPLNTFVLKWDRRLRQQQIVTWLARVLIPGMMLGCVLVVVSWSRPFLSENQIIALALGVLVSSLIVMMAIFWFWPRPVVKAAREFDVRFGLKEKVSTALELIEGRISSNEELTELQLQDAHETANKVAYREELPLVWRWKEWAALILMTLLFVVLLLLPNPRDVVAGTSVAQNTAIQAATDDLKELTEDIAADSTLDDAQREQLLETLETSIQTLEEENITPEEAFATLSEVENTLQEQAESIESQLQAQQSALQDAAESMRQLTPSESTNEVSMDGAAASLEQSAGNLSQSLDQMSQEQRRQAADALDQAAASLEQTDPQTAQALRDAAEALRNDDIQSAQEALNQAAQNMEQTQQSQTQQSQSAQQMAQAAEQTRENASQVGQQSQSSGQQGQNEGQEGESPSDGQSGSQSGDNPQPGEGQSQGQTGEGDSSSGEEGEGQPGAGQSQSNQPSDNSGGGSGDGSGESESNAAGSPQSGEEIEQNNNPDGTGEGDFEPIYAPNDPITRTGDDQIILNPEQGDIPLSEGQLNENPTGNVTVPYNQVFSDYSDAVNRALDSDYIPLGMRDVIRDYFTSLDPSAQRRE